MLLHVSFSTFQLCRSWTSNGFVFCSLSTSCLEKYQKNLVAYFTAYCILQERVSISLPPFPCTLTLRKHLLLQFAADDVLCCFHNRFTGANAWLGRFCWDKKTIAHPQTKPSNELDWICCCTPPELQVCGKVAVIVFLFNGSFDTDADYWDVETDFCAFFFQLNDLLLFLSPINCMAS